jgi:hypothetical protein
MVAMGNSGPCHGNCAGSPYLGVSATTFPIRYRFSMVGASRHDAFVAERATARQLGHQGDREDLDKLQ